MDASIESGTGRDGIAAHRRFLAGIILGLGLLGTPFFLQSASASIGACRDDPVVHLSNGGVIDLTVNIGDSAADLQGVTYTIDAPAGTTMASVTDTGSLPPSLVTINFSARNAPGTYDTSVKVDTGAHGVSVTASTSVPSVGSDTESGVSGHSIPMLVAGS